MSLQQPFARVPITQEPVDGWFVVGAVLVAFGVLGLLTGLLAPVLCGAAALAAVAALQLSGRERPADGSAPRSAGSAPADVAPQPAA